MLKTCRSFLLLTEDKRLQNVYEAVARNSEIRIKIMEKWDVMNRSTEDVIICDSYFADMLNEDYWFKTVVVLKQGESFVPYRKRFDRFVFDRENKNEIAYSLVKIKLDVKREVAELTTVGSIINECGTSVYSCGDYFFDFGNGVYKYKGNGIYLTEGNKIALAKWLLLHKKNSSTRTQAYQMRRKFGNDFLLDVNIKGGIKCQKKKKQ